MNSASDNTKNGSQQEAQQQQQQMLPSGGFPASLAAFAGQQGGAQPQQQLMGGLPFALMGASPLQQQLSALSGFGGAPNVAAPQDSSQQTAQQQLLQTLLASQAAQQQQQQQFQAIQAALQQQQQQQSQQQPQANPLQQAMLLAMQQQQQQQVNPFQQQLQQLMMYQQLLAQQPGMFAALLGGQMPQPQPNPPAVNSAIPNMVSIPGNEMNSNNNTTSGDTKIDSAEWAEPFSGKSKKEPPFPLKLHQILGNPEFSDCITWNPSGRSWRILKPPVFEQVVIPLYFRHAKYASFMRQVNGWGFKRIVSGHDHNSYYHELFIRENPQACLQMKRVRKNNADEPSKPKQANGKKSDVCASQITDTSMSDNSSEEQIHQEASNTSAEAQDTKQPASKNSTESEDNDGDEDSDDSTEDQNSASGHVNDTAPEPQVPQQPQNFQLPPNLSRGMAQPNNVLNSILPGLGAAPANDPGAAALGMLGGMGLDASTLQKLHEALRQRQPPPLPQQEAAPVLGHTAFLAAQLQQAMKGSDDAAKDSGTI